MRNHSLPLWYTLSAVLRSFPTGGPLRSDYQHWRRREPDWQEGAWSDLQRVGIVRASFPPFLNSVRLAVAGVNLSRRISRRSKNLPPGRKCDLRAFWSEIRTHHSVVV